jgi:hypothetical protein
MNKCIISTIDAPPKIEYRGLWSMLDELLKKVKETDDTDKIKLYCDLYAKLYKLLESKGEE